MAKDVITRFKLETTAFDSKIKQASKELSDYSKTATKAKEGFNQFTKANVDAAKALGTMATSTTNAKDRAKELVGAFNDAAKAYNALTKEQQQSDWAKALAGSLTQLQQRIKETKQEMQGLGDSMKGVGGGGLFSGIGSKMEGALAVFGGNMMTAAAGAVANLGTEMADMVQQGIELARQGEGVRIAFERLGRGDILDGLREATHGTVTDIELMKAAVKFNDFKLPVEELGTMLAFAQQKAKDTGQSVDYMVDSIVTGLGRKSLMILDNLGLSAAEIKDKMKDTGDMTKAVGAIIREQMAKAGDYVETAADRAAQANVSLQNKMEELGRKFAPLEEASNTFWTSVKISILDVVGGPLTDFLNGLTEAGRRMDMLKQMNGGGDGNPSKTTRQLSALRGSNFKNEKYSSQLTQYDQDIRVAEYLKNKYTKTGSMGGGLVLSEISRRFNVKIGGEEDIDNLISSLKTMRSEYVQGAKEIMKPVETNIKTDKAEQNVASLKKELKDLEEQRKKAVKSGDQELVEALTKQISQTKTNLGYLDPSAVKTTSTTKKDLDELQKIQAQIAALTKEAYTADEGRQKEIRQQIGGLQEQEQKLTKIRDLVTGKGGDNAPVFSEKELSAFSTRTPDLRGNNGKAQDKFDIGTAAFATSGTSQADISAYISSIKSAIQDANLGSDLYTSLTEKLNDASTMSSVLQQALASGVEGADLAPIAEELKTKLMEGDITDEAWQEFIDKLNELIENEDLKLTFNVDTKSVDTAAKTMAKQAAQTQKAWSLAAQSVSNIGTALNSIEDPGAKAAGTVIKAISDIALGFAQASVQASSLGPWGWIAYLAAGTAAMATTISTVHSLTGFAEGGVIKGNSYSGDNLIAQGPDGSMVGLNAGEVVLNRAQAGVLAASLEGPALGNLQLETRVDAEELIFVLNNNAERRGYGRFIDD